MRDAIDKARGLVAWALTAIVVLTALRVLLNIVLIEDRFEPAFGVSAASATSYEGLVLAGLAALALAIILVLGSSGPLGIARVLLIVSAAALAVIALLALVGAFAVFTVDGSTGMQQVLGFLSRLAAIGLLLAVALGSWNLSRHSDLLHAKPSPTAYGYPQPGGDAPGSYAPQHYAPQPAHIPQGAPAQHYGQQYAPGQQYAAGQQYPPGQQYSPGPQHGRPGMHDPRSGQPLYGGDPYGSPGGPYAQQPGGPQYPPQYGQPFSQQYGPGQGGPPQAAYGQPYSPSPHEQQRAYEQQQQHLAGQPMAQPRQGEPHQAEAHGATAVTKEDLDAEADRRETAPSETPRGDDAGGRDGR